MTDFAVFGFFGKFLQSFEYIETEHMWFPNKHWLSQFLSSLSMSVNILLTPENLAIRFFEAWKQEKKHPLDPKTMNNEGFTPPIYGRINP